MQKPGVCSFPSRRSCVYLVGAGPGDPGLLTVKALCLINRADVVVYDRLVSDEVMQLVPPGVSRIFVGKETGNHCVPQEEINHTLVRLARGGRKVVRLKGGDPFLFGRGGEEAAVLAECGVDYEVVPGISAASACAAYAGIPLTHRNLSHSVIFVTGHGAEGHSLETEIAERYTGNADATLVIFMGVSRLGRIMDALMERGLNRNKPVALIEKGTTADQRRLITTVAEADSEAARAKFGAPTLVVIGEVVRMAETLDWFIPEARGIRSGAVGS